MAHLGGGCLTEGFRILYMKEFFGGEYLKDLEKQASGDPSRGASSRSYGFEVIGDQVLVLIVSRGIRELLPWGCRSANGELAAPVRGGVSIIGIPP